MKILNTYMYMIISQIIHVIFFQNLNKQISF